MKTRIVVITLFLLMIAGAVVGENKRVKADLVGDSGVTGSVEVVQMLKGGSNLIVRVRGLKTGTEYAAYYAKTSDCAPSSPLLGKFVADGNGEGGIEGKVDLDLDQVGSIGVRHNDALLACAKVH